MGAVWPRPTAGARRFGYDVPGIREPGCSPIHAGEVLRIRGADTLLSIIGRVSAGIRWRRHPVAWGRRQGPRACFPAYAGLLGFCPLSWSVAIAAGYRAV